MQDAWSCRSRKKWAEGEAGGAFNEERFPVETKVRDDTVKRAVKYCGGCNPRCNRAAFVRHLEEKFGVALIPAGCEREALPLPGKRKMECQQHCCIHHRHRHSVIAAPGNQLGVRPGNGRGQRGQ